jgi:hypothetical protein
MRIFMLQDLVWHAAMLRFRSMSLKYQSGEEIKAGDHILYNFEPGKIDFVATPEDPQYAWYVEQHGGGCMILVAPFGSLFVSDPQGDQDLEFVARDGSASE